MSRVVLGEHNYTDPGDGQVEAAPSVWTSHPLYDKLTNNYDLAIITLASSLAFSSSGHWDNKQHLIMLIVIVLTFLSTN